MVQKTKIHLIVRYVNGNENKFAFLRDDDESNPVARIEEAVKANVLMLELEDRMMAVPFHNIKSIEIWPKPPKMPRFALRNVRLIS